MTEIVTCTVETCVEDSALIQRCIEVLQSGGVIVYPTDTVYGLGADATNSNAVAIVRAIKGKDADRPILAMVADTAMLETYARLTPLARAIAQEFLPGPVSLVCEAQDDALKSIQSGDGSVGFRMPNSEWCLRLVRAFGKPITSTSVNISGLDQSRTVEGMLQQLGIKAAGIDLAVDSGDMANTTPSSVVDVRGSHPIVLREGAVLRDRFTRFVGV